MARLHRWEIFADAVLIRAARDRHARWGQSFDDFAGAVVDDASLLRLIGELPTTVAHSPESGGGAGDLANAVDIAREALHDHTGRDRFADLVLNADLDEAETEVLALAAALSWNPTRHKLLGYVQDDLTLRGVMTAFIPTLLDRPIEACAAVSPDSRLVRSCLIEVRTDTLVGASLAHAAPSTMWHLAGHDTRDAALPLDAREYDGQPIADSPTLTLVNGADRIRRLQAVSTELGYPRLLVTAEPATDAEWSAVVRTALCRGSVPVLELEQISATTRHWITRSSMVPWVISTRFPASLDHLPRMQFIEVEANSEPVGDDEVRNVLGDVPSGHRLTAEQLHNLSILGKVEGSTAIRRLASGELDQLARRIRPRRSWSELVLPPERLSQVREVVLRVEHRRRVYDDWGYKPVPSAGVLALFAGPSGTGKTMSAEIIAGELGLDLFKVDLSALVSKFIGETEKNLERVFSAAEGGGVVLAFDEADAVFGKRTQVSDAHDRYANIETSYLLQRLESYDGLVVLTTNFAGNIDQAFMRRIHVSVEFPMPEPVERLAIWQTSFPTNAPTADIDFELLADRFKLAGGSIRSASLTAAFLAADENEPVSMRHVVHGVRREFQKIGRVPATGEFAPWF